MDRAQIIQTTVLSAVVVGMLWNLRPKQERKRRTDGGSDGGSGSDGSGHGSGHCGSDGDSCGGGDD